MVYLEQMCIKLLNFVDNHCLPLFNHCLTWTNNTSVISGRDTFLPFLFLVISFSVLPSNFIVSGVKRSK